MMTGHRRYYIVAFLMGLPWFVALLIPPTTRDFLLSWRNWTHVRLVWYIETMLLFCLVSLATAATWRRWIISAVGWQRLWVAVALPFYGCVLFLCGVILLSHLLQIEKILHADNALLLFWGMLSTVFSAYVVVPMGWISQSVMQWAAGASSKR